MSVESITINKAGNNELTVTAYPETHSLWISINNVEGNGIRYILSLSDIRAFIGLANFALERTKNESE